MTDEIRPPTAEELMECIWNGTEGFETLLNPTVGTWRHGSEHAIIAKRESDGTIWRLKYRSTPDGICDDFVGKIQRVYPHQKTITEYTTEP
jgi:hypothetical protein